MSPILFSFFGYSISSQAFVDLMCAGLPYIMFAVPGLMFFSVWKRRRSNKSAQKHKLYNETLTLSGRKSPTENLLGQGPPLSSAVNNPFNARDCSEDESQSEAESQTSNMSSMVNPKKTVVAMPPLALSMQCLQCGVWMLYGLGVDNFSIVVANFGGFILGWFYVILYPFFWDVKSHEKEGQTVNPIKFQYFTQLLSIVVVHGVCFVLFVFYLFKEQGRPVPLWYDLPGTVTGFGTIVEDKIRLLERNAGMPEPNGSFNRTSNTVELNGENPSTPISGSVIVAESDFQSFLKVVAWTAMATNLMMYLHPMMTFKDVCRTGKTERMGSWGLNIAMTLNSFFWALNAMLYMTTPQGGTCYQVLIPNVLGCLVNGFAICLRIGFTFGWLHPKGASVIGKLDDMLQQSEESLAHNNMSFAGKGTATSFSNAVGSFCSDAIKLGSYYDGSGANRYGSLGNKNIV